MRTKKIRKRIKEHIEILKQVPLSEELRFFDFVYPFFSKRYKNKLEKMLKILKKMVRGGEIELVPEKRASGIEEPLFFVSLDEAKKPKYRKRAV